MQIIRVKGINGLGKTEGCEKAPVEVLRKLEIDKQLDFEEIHVNNQNVEEANELIYKNSREIFSEQDKALFIGGDHSISYSIVKGFKDNFNGFLIVFDAHVDCMKPMKEPTHEEWLRRLIEEGFPVENILLVGVRKIYDKEKEFLDKNKIKIVGTEELGNKGEVLKMLMEKVKGKEGFYISVDIDVVDSEEASGTGYLEPGGMKSEDLIYFLKKLSKLDNFKGGDIVEINPDKDENEKTVELGARLLGGMI